MFLGLLFFIILVITRLVTSLDMDIDENTENIYCQMNEFFKLRILNGQKLFPCSQ